MGMEIGVLYQGRPVDDGKLSGIRAKKHINKEQTDLISWTRKNRTDDLRGQKRLFRMGSSLVILRSLQEMEEMKH